MKKRYLSLMMFIGLAMVGAGAIIAQNSATRLAMPAAGTSHTVGELRNLIRVSNQEADFLLLVTNDSGVVIGSTSARAAGLTAELDRAASKIVILDECDPGLIERLIAENRLPGAALLRSLKRDDPYYPLISGLVSKYRRLLVSFELELMSPKTKKSESFRFYLVDPNPAKMIRIAGKRFTSAALNNANRWK